MCFRRRWCMAMKPEPLLPGGTDDMKKSRAKLQNEIAGAAALLKSCCAFPAPERYLFADISRHDDDRRQHLFLPPVRLSPRTMG